MKYSIFFFIVCLFSSFSWANERSCLSTYTPEWKQTKHYNTAIRVISEFSDCLIEQKNLSQFAAQSILLKKLNFIIVHRGEFRPGEVSVELVANPYADASSANLILLNMQDLRETTPDLLQAASYLEQNVYSKVISGDVIQDKQRYWAQYDAVIRSHIAAADHSPKGTKEGPGNYYPGTLFSTYNHLSSLQSKYPLIARALVTPSQFKNLQNYHSTFKVCSKTRCYERMYRRVVQGQMLFLSHPEFVKALYEKPLTNFKAPQLAKALGCFVSERISDERTVPDPAFFANGGPISYRHNFSSTHEYGWRGYIGELLYIQALNRDAVHDDVYMGQNGLVRSFSVAAYNDLVNMGGFGGRLDVARNRHPVVRETVDEQWIQKNYPTGASHRIVRYWLLMKRGEKQAAEQLISSPFFTDTNFFDGKSLKWWVEFGYRRNPGTPYHLWTQDFHYNQSYAYGSFIDRVVELTHTFESIQNQF